MLTKLHIIAHTAKDVGVYISGMVHVCTGCAIADVDTDTTRPARKIVLQL